MADKYFSDHLGNQIDAAIAKVQNLDSTINIEGAIPDSKAVGEAIKAAMDIVSSPYNVLVAYQVGVLFTYSGKLYECIKAAPAGTLPTDTTYFREVTVSEILDDIVEGLKNGTIVPDRSNVSNNLTPYSEDSGTAQNTPFILQGTACANGEEQADTGSYCQLQRKNGNTVTVNQQFNYSTVQNTTVADVTRTNNGDGSFTFSGTASANAYTLLDVYATVFKGHKYLFYGYDTSAINVKNYVYQAFPITYNVINTIQEPTSDYNGAIFQKFVNSGDDATGKVEIYVIDLTLWFGSNDKIPTHLLNHPEDFSRYYQGSLAYNAGTLTDCNGRYLKTWKRNIFDGILESGDINSATGEDIVDNRYLRSKNYIRCIPNETYYYYSQNQWASFRFYDADKNFIVGANAGINIKSTFKVPANAIFMRFVQMNNVQADITISLYYEGESGYDQYYPYEELANIDTGNEPLLAFDYKTPDGVIHRNTGRVDLGTLTYGYVASSGVFYPTSMPSDFGGTRNARCSSYTIQPSTTSAVDIPDKAIEIRDASTVYLRNSAYTDAATFKAAMSGVYLEYELADSAKTTEQGTPFAENVAIDDFGPMAFDCPNGVPQGNLIFYPVDYKAEIDTLHNITDGDMHKIALKGDLASGDPDTIKGVIDAYNALYAINQENMGGTLRHILIDRVTAGGGALDFNDTTWADLGELDGWFYVNNDQQTFFQVTLPNAKSQLYTSLNGICSKYAIKPSEAGWGVDMPDKSFGLSLDTIRIKDTRYTDVNAFKADMKGILVAYEKTAT